MTEQTPPDEAPTAYPESWLQRPDVNAGLTGSLGVGPADAGTDPHWRLT